MKKQILILTMLSFIGSHELSAGKAGVGIGAGLAGFAIGRATSGPRYYDHGPRYVEKVVVERPTTTHTVSSDRNTIRRLENIMQQSRLFDCKFQACRASEILRLGACLISVLSASL